MNDDSKYFHACGLIYVAVGKVGKGCDFGLNLRKFRLAADYIILFNYEKDERLLNWAQS